MKERFDDIAEIVEDLKNMKNQTQSVQDMNTAILHKIQDLEYSNRTLQTRTNDLMDENEKLLEALEGKHDDYALKLNGFATHAASKMDELKEDYQESMEQALALIVKDAKEKALSLKESMDLFYDNIKSTVKQSEQSLGETILQSISQNVNELTELINKLNGSTEQTLQDKHTELSSLIQEQNRLSQEQMQHLESLLKAFDQEKRVMLKTMKIIMTVGFVVLFILIIVMALLF